MDLLQKFEASVANSKSLTERPSNDILLKIYSLFKQATEGDNSSEKPGGFDFKAIAKYRAWEAQKGKPKNACMQEYVELIDSLK